MKKAEAVGNLPMKDVFWNQVTPIVAEPDGIEAIFRAYISGFSENGLNI